MHNVGSGQFEQSAVGSNIIAGKGVDHKPRMERSLAEGLGRLLKTGLECLVVISQFNFVEERTSD